MAAKTGESSVLWTGYTVVINMKIVTSKFLRTHENIVYHSLYGNPVRVDTDVNHLLHQLTEPRDLEDFADPDCLSALKDLIQRGHIIPFRDLNTEYKRWQRNIQEIYKREPLLTGGIVFLVTTACNLSCTYCMCSHTVPTRKVMSYSTAEAALQKYMEYCESVQVKGNPLLIFTGGEPLLQASLVQRLCRYASREYPDKLNFRIITNGALIDPEIAAFLKTYAFDIVVSLDGDEHTNCHRKYHDGSPSYADVLTGIETLLSQGVAPHHISLSAVYNEEYPGGVCSLFPYMSKRGITNMNLNVNNLSFMQVPPRTMARHFVDMRSQAASKGINLSGRWAVPAYILRSKENISAVCSGAARAKLFVQPGGELTLCDYHPGVIGTLEHFEQYVITMNSLQNNYLFGRWAECRGCEIEGFCSPCILEKEVIHKGDVMYQQQKCEFLKSCTRLLLQE